MNRIVSEAQRSNPHQILTPSPWVERFVSLLDPGSRVLDLACGYGRHARWLAGLGHRVLAVDRDEVALAMLSSVAGIDTQRADLEQDAWPFGDTRFDAIVVTHYLHRPLLGPLLDALDPRGVLLYETFAQGNEAFGRPANPDFLLQPDELLERFGSALRVIAFEQGQFDQPFPAVIQRICATGRARPWPVRLPPSIG